MTAEPRSFPCPSCGSVVTPAMRDAVVVTCAGCAAVLDARADGHAVLAKHAQSMPVPRIPLGHRGKLDGRELTCVAHLTRVTDVGGSKLTSDEYLLVGGKESRWLVCEDDEWMLLAPFEPAAAGAGATSGGFGGVVGKAVDRDLEVRTVAVAGTLPDRILPGHRARVSTFDSYVDDAVTTQEIDDEGTRWFRGRAIPAARVWQAFGLEPLSVKWLALALAVLLAVVQIAACDAVPQAPLLVANLDFDAAAPERARITEPFTLPRRARVAIQVDTPVENNWASFQLALLSPDDPHAVELGVDVEQWHGVDSDGTWVEGSRQGRTTVGLLNPGSWRLRIEPQTPLPAMWYAVTVGYAFPDSGWLILTWLLLAGAWGIIVAAEVRSRYRLVQGLFIGWGVALAVLLAVADARGWSLLPDDRDSYDTHADIRSNPRLYHMQSHAK